jgi:hypothetical protein
MSSSTLFPFSAIRLDWWQSSAGLTSLAVELSFKIWFQLLFWEIVIQASTLSAWAKSRQGYE